MSKFFIIEIDKDYRCESDRFFKEFKTQEDAENWCKKETWSGHSYHVIIGNLSASRGR